MVPRPPIISILFLLVLSAAPLSARAADAPPRSVIDEHLRAAWEQQKITPAGPADDAAFLRRVYLDLVGTIPTYDEIKAFLEDTSSTKRDAVIHRLLDDPRYAQQQMSIWDLTLFGRNPASSEVRKRDAWRDWLRGQFEKNEPYDKWVRQLLLAEEEGSTVFYAQFQNKPEDLTEAFSKAFLGTQLQCARCHDHPYTPLTQRDFFGMTGFFVRLVVIENGTTGDGANKQKRFNIGEKSSGEVLFAGNMKELKPGKKGDPVKPKFLAGSELDEPALPKDFKEVEVKTGIKAMPKPVFSRKEKLADWATSGGNPFFARAAVNRIWGQFMGRGIVHPIDNLGDDNKPSLPALLDALTKEFIAHQFDMKWLIREIVSSQAYQISGEGPVTDALPAWWERARVRPLSAEEIAASLKVAGGDAEPAKQGGDTSEYFLRYFGEPTNGQGDFQGGLGEHLFLNNSDNVRKFFSKKKGNLADTLAASKDPWEQRVDRMFLSVLTRMPTDAEREKFVAFLQSEPKTEQVIEEAIWVLVNTSEFRFNR